MRVGMPVTGIPTSICNTRQISMSCTKRWVVILLAAVLAAGLPSPPLFAGTTGKIAGRVLDGQTKEPLVGVNVVIVGTALGAASDPDGNYFIVNLPPGTYELKASAVGYAPVTVSNVKVSADQTTKVDFELQTQAVEVGAVEITATRPIVQRDLTSTTATVSREQISKLPVEDVQSIVNLQAGVVEGHFRGGRSDEVKYLVDGVPVNDVFSGASTLSPEINSIQEVQVLSGTFNAEYGEALSGVVNQVTRMPGEKYSGSLSLYTGDYVSRRTGLYRNISHISPADLYNFEGSLSGPVPGAGEVLKFYFSGRHYYDDGYLYGKRMFEPWDSSNFNASNSSDWHIGATGDGAYVPMNYQKRSTLQAKLSIGLPNARTITLQGLYQQNDYRVYNHAYVLNPDGDYKYHQKSFLGTLMYTHVINNAAFIDFRGSAFISDYHQSVFDNPVDNLGNIHVDTGYISPAFVQQQGLGANAFLVSGTENWDFRHHTNTYSGKIDLTDQVDTKNQIKAGIEGSYYRLRYQDFQVHVDARTNFVPSLPAYGSFDFNVYKNHPYQFAGYIQDKIELDYLIVNAGIRYDFFEPDGDVLVDPSNIQALDSLQPPYPGQYLRRARSKSQISPRFGLSYPITDKGAVHISYGHFFQMPAFDFLFKNPNFRIPQSGNFPDFVGSVIGNADLEPQRTTIYEIGLQQEVFANIGVTLTGYYKDIRNLLGIRSYYKGNVRKFGEYINHDYGDVKGITLSLERRLIGGFGATLDYTFQVAQGSASDPTEDFNKAQATPPIPVNKSLVPLSWDRRHSLNFTVTAGTPGTVLASLVGRLGSGLPYTPSLENQRTGLENSDNMPTFFDTDLYLTKEVSLPDFVISLFMKIYNVFDTQSEINVFTDSGRAGYTLALTQSQPPHGVNSLSDYFTRPDFYSSPRQIVVGATMSF